MKKIKVKSVESKPGFYQIWINEVEQKEVVKVNINELKPGELAEVQITYLTNDLELDLETEDKNIKSKKQALKNV